MLNPIITEYIAADRTDEAHRHADRARLAREVRTRTREARATRLRIGPTATAIRTATAMS